MNSSAKVEISPQFYTRTGGLLYLAIIIIGIFGELLVREQLVVSGDPDATANNLMNSPTLWRMGIAGDIVMHILDIPLMLIFYILLRPVSRNLALLAMLFTLVQTAVLVATKLSLFTPLFLSGKEDYLKVFDQQQLHTLLYISIRSDNYGFGIGLLFFGVACLLLGYLIIRSGYLPKAIGFLMQIAGLCYLINSFTLILSPEFSKKIGPAILVPCFIGELSFCLWLLVKGVNVAKWKEKINLAAP